MKRTLIARAKQPGKLMIQGFVDAIRNTKHMAFVVIRDTSGSIQVTIDKAATNQPATAAQQLTPESTVTVIGSIQQNHNVKLGGLEIIPESIEIESLAMPLPLLPDSSIDTRLDYRWLDLRQESGRMIFQVQSAFVEAMRKFLLSDGFIEIHTPKLIGAASESGAEVFELDYFERKAYLAQSPQYYKQMAMAAALERIFEIGPVFRAEKSHTRKHATEFTGLDVELSWIQSFHDVMALEEAMLAHALGELAQCYGDDIQRLFGVKLTKPTIPFPVITMSALYAQLERRYGYRPEDSDRGDLTTEAEQLCQRFSMEAYGHEFLFVTDFAPAKRAFYHKREAGVALGYDLIWRGVEITTGAQREHRHDILMAQAREKGLGDDIRFYADFFRYGCPPHGGFGLGVDRMTMLILGLASLKEAMFVFRGPNRLTP